MPVAMVKDAERSPKAAKNRTNERFVREALRHYATSRRTDRPRRTSNGSLGTIGEAKRILCAGRKIIAEDSG